MLRKPPGTLTLEETDLNLKLPSCLCRTDLCTEPPAPAPGTAAGSLDPEPPRGPPAPSRNPDGEPETKHNDAQNSSDSENEERIETESENEEKETGIENEEIGNSEDKETESEDKEIGSEDKEIGSEDKETESEDKETEIENEEIGSEDKETGIENEETGIENEETGNVPSEMSLTDQRPLAGPDPHTVHAAGGELGPEAELTGFLTGKLAELSEGRHGAGELKTRLHIRLAAMTLRVCIPTEQEASSPRVRPLDALEAGMEASSMHCPQAPVCQWYTVHG
ncbi:hypothetical protein F7725_024657 [Dissostichus mawsoni]|uniref:Uncharacterized protein n=1 Tax=Dissostichus mawsoni TaxID=36200 RepID=A0A7J5X9G4_DISMA|nr:hypothetical protein F7725_024657 [Dissostichus mawsoni]